MGQPVTAVFDIGKTNKKFFLFGPDFKEVGRRYTQLPQTEDEDGYPCEDLQALEAWMASELKEALARTDIDIRALNISSYGASLVHLGRDGQVLTPLYNYTKPYPEALEDAFYTAYGPEAEFSRATGTTRAGMLTSGLQLYRLKHEAPERFAGVVKSLHLPQYLSYRLTGVPVSDYTSIGCHTGLWDYTRGGYHRWVEAEGMASRLAPIVGTGTSYSQTLHGKTLRIGVGIHDSSAALLPYLESSPEPFVLLSTGTWSVAMNPFSDGVLSPSDSAHNCINYMRVDGQPVKAARLFLGQEFKAQVKRLCAHYGQDAHAYQQAGFNPEHFEAARSQPDPCFHWEHLQGIPGAAETRYDFPDFSRAYHQLVYELCRVQEGYLRHVIGASEIRHLYIDGGFGQNAVFVAILARLMHPMELHTTDAALGSALGAAVVVSGRELEPGFLQTHYHMKSHHPYKTH
ncbi:FGGY family carbohydrate kinase [Robiginitalea sp. M366]|uniref:FGGY-family carbohydrate kinase n=1 Tax=Robiginitalea aestuariiviva TaxID=3036903 RepID=UPI00240E5354|nr:FGGY family carbohydrate kinase [Robiginitalea aestuariiviva]MDG1573341.1 FGGY family carbohydrate kinase [Robiginitalea aestuariiviva]